MQALFLFMATFRKVHVSFWSDPFTQDLTPEQKYFFLYLITNEKTSQCGIYEITKRHICYDTGYNIDTVSKLLNFFIDTGKIKYNYDTSEIAIKNWLKYNDNASPKVKVFVNQELRLIKDKTLIQYLYSIDTSLQVEVEKKRKEVVVEEKTTTTGLDEISEMIKKIRPELTEKILQKERLKFETVYPERSLPKHAKLVIEWAERINYTPRETSKNTFDKVAQQNKEKYGL